MITYLGYKTEIEFNGNLLDMIKAQPEEARAIIKKDNGEYAIAYYCYQRFGSGEHWVIWSDDEYDSQFKAMIAADVVCYNTFLNKWMIKDGVEYVTEKGLSKNNLK